MHGLQFGCHTGSGVCAGVDSGHRLHQLVGVRDGHGGGLHVSQQSPHVRYRRLAVLGGAGGGCFGLWRVTACPCQRERVLCQHQRLDASYSVVGACSVVRSLDAMSERRL